MFKGRLPKARGPKASPGSTLVYLPQQAALVDTRNGLVTRAWWPWFEQVVAAIEALIAGGGGGGGGGDVTGPAGAVSGHVATFSGSTGKVIADSGVAAAVLARTDVTNAFTADQGIVKGAPLLAFIDTSQAANAQRYQTRVAGGLLRLEATNDAGTALATVTIDRNGVLTAAGLDGTPLAAGNLTGTVPLASLPAHQATHRAGGTDPLPLDALAAPITVSGLDATTVVHGLLPRLSGNAAQFLNGTGGWATPAGGGGTGDVVGPAGGVVTDELALYSGTTGKLIKGAGGLVPTLLARLDRQNTFSQDQTFSLGFWTRTWYQQDEVSGPTWTVQANYGVLKFMAQSTPVLDLAQSGAVTVYNDLTVTGDGGNVARRPANNTFTGSVQMVQSANPTLHLYDTSGTANQRRWRQWGNQASLRFDLLTDDATGLVAQPLRLDGTGSVAVGADVYEKGRVTPMGHWQAVPFAASNFFGLGGLVWTVTSGQVSVNRYTLVGKTLTWACMINNSTLSGTAAANLGIALPQGVGAAAAQVAVAKALLGGVWGYCDVQVPSAGANYVQIGKVDFSNWATGAHYLYFTATIELQ